MANNDDIENNSGTPLHLACSNQNLELVRSLLENGARLDAIDNLCYTPLHAACKSKSDVTVTIIELLLEHHADIEAPNILGRTPLFIACIKNNYAAVKCLLENHANINTVDDARNTLLHCISGGNGDDVAINIAQLLLQYHANIEAANSEGHTPLLTACFFHNDVAIKFFLDHHANPCVVNYANSTSLHLVCETKSNKTVTLLELLLQNHVNIEAVDTWGTTPLMVACNKGNHDAIECLLAHHANIEAVDRMGRTPLIVACKTNNYEVIKCLLDHNANIEAVDSDRKTPLMVACDEGNCDAIKCLLDHHANTEAVDRMGQTPLMIACKKGHHDAIKCLLDHHANIEAVDMLGWSSLMIACDRGDHAIVKCLLDHHANIEAVDMLGWNSLMIACDCGDHDIVKCLLDHHVNFEVVDRRDLTLLMVARNNENHDVVKCLLLFEKYRKFKILDYYANNCWKTSLHWACKNQNLELVKSLLEDGANPNNLNDKLSTALHFACLSESDVTVKIIKLLLEHHADIEAADSCGWTPLFTACMHNNYAAVKCLLENHADVNARDRMDHTPLHWIFFGNSDDITISIAQLLLQYHANIEAASSEGHTPLLIACHLHNDVAIKFFLDNHANPCAVNYANSTSLHLVCDKKSNKTVTLLELLLQNHANIEAVDRTGATPLIVACNKDNHDAIKCLLDNQANVNHSDSNNLTPLHIAVEKRSVVMTRWLVECGADINILDNDNQTPLEKAYKFKQHDPLFMQQIMEIKHILNCHVIESKVAGFKVHDHNLNKIYNTDFCEWKKPWMSKYEIKCQKEIEKMRNEKMGINDITFYDLLNNNIDLLLQFVADEKFQHKLKQEYLEKHFPSYKNILQSRFREATILYTRKKLLKQAKEYFWYVIDHQLPYEITDFIFCYLNNRDLKVILNVKKLTNDQQSHSLSIT